MESDPTYAYKAQPRPAQTVARQKYRDPDEGEDRPQNLMHHRGIIRGNTYALRQLQQQSMEAESRARSHNSKRRKLGPSQYESAGAQQALPRTPEAIPGRQHIDIQTENYLEELVDEVAEIDVDTQTDAFLDRPASPIYVPQKSGIDVETQIYEGDLFDFDLEVEPILDVVVGKILEQAQMEVLEEEDLATLRAHQDEFDRIRQAELAETQRMEAAEKRRFEEKERRAKQERERLEREEVVKQKVAARSFAKDYMHDMLSGVFTSLSTEGFFYDPLEKEVEEDFMPWLWTTAEKSAATEARARDMVDMLVRAAISLRVQRATKGEVARKEKVVQDIDEKARLAALEAEKAKSATPEGDDEVADSSA